MTTGIKEEVFIDGKNSECTDLQIFGIDFRRNRSLKMKIEKNISVSRKIMRISNSILQRRNIIVKIKKKSSQHPDQLCPAIDRLYGVEAWKSSLQCEKKKKTTFNKN